MPGQSYPVCFSLVDSDTTTRVRLKRRQSIVMKQLALPEPLIRSGQHLRLNHIQRQPFGSHHQHLPTLIGISIPTHSPSVSMLTEFQPHSTSDFAYTSLLADPLHVDGPQTIMPVGCVEKSGREIRCLVTTDSPACRRGVEVTDRELTMFECPRHA